MQSQFFGGAYTLRSLPLAAQTCINLYLEPNESGQGDPAGFYGTPGKRRLVTLAGGAHRGAHEAGGYLWVVVGPNVWRLDATYAATLVGTLPNSTGPVEVFDNGIDLIVAHQGGWHTCLLAGGALTFVPNSEGTSDGSFVDNFLVQTKTNGAYQWARVGTTTIDLLNFASAEGNPDPIIRTLVDHRELWLFGTKSIEINTVTSDPDLPFVRTTFIEQGLLAKRSAVKQDNTVFWLGRNEKGQGIVYRADGHIPARISTFAIEQEIARYADPTAATAFTYQQDGHHFYVLNFAEATWRYDINTGLWAQGAYRRPATGAIERDRAETHVLFNGVHVVGDYADGRLYALELDTFTDDGDEIYRERGWCQQTAENRLIAFTRGELVGEFGVGLSGSPGSDWADPQVALSWSDDGGRTYGSILRRSMGRIGEYKRRALWWQMGAARRRFFRLSYSAATRVAWTGFNLNATVGDA